MCSRCGDGRPVLPSTNLSSACLCFGSLAQYVGGFVSYYLGAELSAYTKLSSGLALWPSVLITCGKSPHLSATDQLLHVSLNPQHNPSAQHSQDGISSVWPAPAPSQQSPQSHVPLCLASLERPRRGASKAAVTALVIIFSYSEKAWRVPAITPSGSSRTGVQISHLNSLMSQPLGHFRLAGDAGPPLDGGHAEKERFPVSVPQGFCLPTQSRSSNKAVSKIAS